MSETLLILGASVRAAAASAVRAGLRPRCVDLFADADLARLAPVERVAKYPCGFWDAARRAPAGPWMYTGGLENYPAVVDRIAAVRPLYGNPGAALRRVRDPWQLADVARDAGLPCPQLAHSGEGLPRDGSWLRKALRSSGGLRVETWNADNPAGLSTRGWYFQERIGGPSYAALFVAAGGRCEPLGITRQYVGGDGELGSHTGAPPFHYAGSIGPVSLPGESHAKLEQLGAALASQFGLSGLFGVDLVLGGGGLWPIEVNPRYPASAEVLERAMAFSAVGCHVAACRDRRLPELRSQPSGETVSGKAILYASKTLSLDAAACVALCEMNDSGQLPSAADIPAAPGEFPAGAPIVTLLADGQSADQVARRLAQRIDELRRRLSSVAAGPLRG